MIESRTGWVNVLQRRSVIEVATGVETLILNLAWTGQLVREGQVRFQQSQSARSDVSDHTRRRSWQLAQ